MSGIPYTFGKSLASIQLALELQKADSKTRCKVSTHIQSFCAGLNSLEEIKSAHIRRSFANMWLENFINHNLEIKSPKHFNFDTTMKNVIHYRFRRWLEEHGEIVDKKQLVNLKDKNLKQNAKTEEWVKKNLP